MDHSEIGAVALGIAGREAGKLHVLEPRELSYQDLIGSAWRDCLSGLVSCIPAGVASPVFSSTCLVW
jgi:hypothetical protein